MASIIGDLAVRIGANTEDLQAGLGKARTGLKDVASAARTGATEFVKYAAAATAAGAAIAAAMVVNSAQAAKEIKNLSNIANTSVGTFQKMAFAAQGVGIQQDKLSDILKDFSDRVGDFNATGGGPMVDFFEKIAPKVGITAKAFQNLSGDQALQLYVDSLEKANLSQADMVFYMEAMASDSTALLPLLKNNGKALAEQAKRAEDLGLALSEINTERLVQMSSSLAGTKDIFSSLSEELSAQLAPVITQITKDFEGMAIQAGGVGKIAADSFNVAIDAGAFLANAIDGVNRVTMLAGASILQLGNTLGMVWSGIASTMLNEPVNAANFLIEKFNELSSILGMESIPTISLSEWGQAANAEYDAHASQIEERAKVMREILNEPLAGNSFKNYVLSAQQSADESVKAVIGGKQREFDSLVEWGEIIDEELKAQRESKRQAEIDEDAFLNELIAAGEQKRYEIAAEAAQKQNKLDEMQAAAREAALGDMMSNLASLMGSKSRKMFEIGKVAAIANTVVSSIQGAQAAFTGMVSTIPGPPGVALGVAAAGAAIAAGAVRVQAINAQSFNKGSVSGAAAGAIANNIGNQVSGGQSGPSQVQYVQGINPSYLFSGEQVINLINNAQENGARLVIL